VRAHLTCFVALLLAVGAGAQEEREEISVELSVEPPIPMITVSDEFVGIARFAANYFEIGEHEEAYEHLRKADAMIPNHPAILYNGAVVLVAMGRYAEAAERIQTYLRIHPYGEEAPRVKELYLELEFQRDLQKRQQQSQSYIEEFNRGRFEFEQGRYAKALEIFQQAELLRSDDAAAAFNQALAYEALGDYARATERLRHHLALGGSATDKAEIDRKIFRLEQEIEYVRTSYVCPFCGHRLPLGATWCHRCWHGPYLLESPRLNTLPCGVGASATRTSYFSDGRLAKNETLDCRIDGTFLESVRYSKPRQRAIQQTRKNEGWIYRDDVIHRLEDQGDVLIELIQGDSLEGLLSRSSGDALFFTGARRGNDDWLLNREERVIDGQLYVKIYEYGPDGGIAREHVTYQNDRACGHINRTSADYVWEAGRLSSVELTGGNDGFVAEGRPKTQWNGAITWSYDDHGRISRETFTLLDHTKRFESRTRGAVGDVMKRLYPGFRPKRDIDIHTRGDRCGYAGNREIGNEIDLRPFDSITPNLAVQVPFGVVRLTVDYTYPTGFQVPSVKAAASE
jgi:ribosomal protein L40E